MNGPFHVVHIQPRTGYGTIPTLGHWDVARLLHAGLRTLGKPVTLAVNEFRADAVNVVVGYECLAPESMSPHAKYIVYQLEQICAGGRTVNDTMRHVLLNAAEVWDYDPANLEVLQSVGVNKCRHLRLGFHEDLATVAPQQEDVDVLFYGIMNQRRFAILQELNKRCTVRYLHGLFGEQRDHWIGRSKIVLSIHFYEAHLAEQVRVSYLLNNRKCVVSEASAWDPFAELCTTVPYAGLVDACMRLLNDEALRKEQAERGAERYRQRPMAEDLRTLLEKGET